VTELLLYQLGAGDDADLERAVGRTLRLEYRAGVAAVPDLLLAWLGSGSGKEVTPADEQALERLLGRLPEFLARENLSPEERAALAKLVGRQTARPSEVLLAVDLTICGVLRCPAAEESRRWARWDAEADLLVPSATAEELYARLPWFRGAGYSSVLVEVEDFDHVREVNDQVKALGLRGECMLDFIEQERFTYLLIFSGMTLVALAALTVAALGIANTMLISVLERVREIGVMKAVGARDGHVLAIFLVEGAMVGLLGGLLGLLLAWGVSFPADAWVRGLLASRTRIKLESSVFAFPWWLLLSGPAFACLATTLAAFYPARRAARIDPVTALRHE
jgi:putative ABC transport system permease protein